jgi:hypothetical protein
VFRTGKIPRAAGGSAAAWREVEIDAACLTEQPSGERNEVFPGRRLLASDRGSQQLPGLLLKRPAMGRGAGLKPRVERVIKMSDQQAGHKNPSRVMRERSRPDWNRPSSIALGVNDTVRAENITYSMNGKRLTYRRIGGQEEATPSTAF